jgi:hypothetical protein
MSLLLLLSGCKVTKTGSFEEKIFPWQARSKLLPYISRMILFLLFSGWTVTKTGPSFGEKNFPWQAPSKLLPYISRMSLFLLLAGAFQGASLHFSNEPVFATFRMQSHGGSNFHTGA